MASTRGEKGNGVMEEGDLRRYWSRVTEGRSAEAKVVHPESVVTAPWVRMKCQFGCTGYGRGYCCPPDTPTPEQTRSVLDSYERAILFQLVSEKGVWSGEEECSGRIPQSAGGPGGGDVQGRLLQDPGTPGRPLCVVRPVCEDRSGALPVRRQGEAFHGGMRDRCLCHCKAKRVRGPPFAGKGRDPEGFRASPHRLTGLHSGGYPDEGEERIRMSRAAIAHDPNPRTASSA